MKVFFVLKDNILDKRLTAFINSQLFVENRKQIRDKVSEIIDFYAENFTLNDKQRAEREL